MTARIGMHLCLTAAVALAAAAPIRGADQAADEYFEKHVRPILVVRCYECHSGQSAKPKGGLRLDSVAAALKGGDTGPAVVPGKPQESLLIDAINYVELYQMPPKSRLPAEEVATLTKWVKMGAPWPADAAAASSAGSAAEFDLAKRKAEHWCWQPIEKPPIPQLRAPHAAFRTPLDAFILAKLQDRGLSPAPRADERTLIRRAYFDLIGLPPPVDDLSVSYEELIDKLLASPRFGERWGRHWLDLVRYAESRGHEFDYTIPNAFEYRDYVIRALNADVPYGQFVIEHVAGDLLPTPRLHPKEGSNESIIGTGYWFLGEWCHSPVDIRKDECDRIDNMIDVFSKTFLGVTVACARCHDHKFDAISQRDYYALAGYLHSSSYRLARFETWQHDRQLTSELNALDVKYRPLVAAAAAEFLRPKIDELTNKVAIDFNHLRDELGVSEIDLHGAKVIVDYADCPPDAWMSDGPTFGSGPVLPGQLVVTDDADAPLEVATYGAARRDPAVTEMTLSPNSENDPGRLAGWLRAGRTLKTPTFTLESGSVHYLIEGVGHVYAVVDSHAMINGPLHAELLKETGGTSDLPARWVTHDLARYVGHRVHLEFTPSEDEDFRVLMVVDGRERPAAPANRPNRLLNFADRERELACREVIAKTIDALAANHFNDADQPRDLAAIANWLTSAIDFTADERLRGLLTEHTAARQALVAKLKPDSRLCLAMWDGTPTDEHLLIRGNHKTVGPVVPRRTLEAIQEPGGRSQETVVSGRLQLARQLVDRSNPLVSRVIVNRVWQHLMGRGIVPSVDNFGVLGQPPTHQELLDYLADEFMRDGWSIKRLIKRIMLSSTYQMASRAPSQSDGRRQPLGNTADESDPQNHLFHRQSLKRLEGEAIRDAILAVSGSLDPKLYGPSVPTYLTPFMQGRGRPKDSGPLDGDGRRSIYTAVRRNFLSPMMLAFDTPIPFTTIGSRNQSNVPAQALILMNDPFVVEQSRHWARRLLADDPAATSESRIRRMYLSAFSREPIATEISAALTFLDQQALEYQIPGLQPRTDESIWADFAHVLFNMKDFVFVQ